MAKRKSKRRRSPKTISVLNVLESLTYASIITEGVAGTSVFGLFGDTDLTQTSVYDAGLGTSSMTWTGGGALSLGDIVSEPGQAPNRTEYTGGRLLLIHAHDSPPSFEA